MNDQNIVTVADLAWPEVQERLDKGCKIAVVPMGHTEQHGPHLPMGSDTYHVSEMVKRSVQLATQESGKPIALVFPTLPYGNGGKYANGEVRLRPSTLMAVLGDICKELAEAGFTKVIVPSGHGANMTWMANAANEAHRLGLVMDIFNVYPLSFMGETIKQIKETKIYGHACEIETSLALYLFPELVHMDKVTSDGEKPYYWYELSKYKAVRDEDVDQFEEKFEKFPDDVPGYVGNPKKASKEKGEKLVNAYIRGFADFLFELDKG